MLATESEARIHAAREAALAAEAVLEARQEEARELRKSHEKAVAELKAEMAEKKRRGKEGVAAKLEVKSIASFRIDLQAASRFLCVQEGEDRTVGEIA